MKSNLFFYAKYRPVSLDDFLCNTKTVQISNSDSVTFITGESGNGKTTLAKLLAEGMVLILNLITLTQLKKLVIVIPTIS